MEMICKFNKLKPSKFEGGSDPLICEEWLRTIENLSEVMECPERFTVRLAIHKFEWEDEYW